MLYTIGHSSLPWQDFSSLTSKIDLLIDVRSHPGSHWPQYQQEFMSKELGARYQWWATLGGWTNKHLHYRQWAAKRGVDLKPYFGQKFCKGRIAQQWKYAGIDPTCPLHGCNLRIISDTQEENCCDTASQLNCQPQQYVDYHCHQYDQSAKILNAIPHIQDKHIEDLTHHNALIQPTESQADIACAVDDAVQPLQDVYYNRQHAVLNDTHDICHDSELLDVDHILGMCLPLTSPSYYDAAATGMTDRSIVAASETSYYNAYTSKLDQPVLSLPNADIVDISDNGAIEVVGCTCSTFHRSYPDAPLKPAWRSVGLYDYAYYTILPEFQDAAKKLMELAASINIGIFCCEAPYFKCHRSMISDYTVFCGSDATHINWYTTKKYGIRATYKLHSEVINNRIERYPQEVRDTWVLPTLEALL